MGKKRNQRKNQIKSTYFNKKHPAGFGGQEKLKRALKNKVSGSLVSDWLQGTDTYTLHKPVKKTFCVENTLYLVSILYGNVTFQTCLSLPSSIMVIDTSC